MGKNVNRKQFREMCGTKDRPLNQHTLNSDIRRGNVLVDEEGLIDPKLPINAEYIEKKTKEVDGSVQKAKIEFDARKKELEVRKAQEDLKVATLRRQKMEGELIPTVLVKKIFRSHFKNLKKTFHVAAEQISIDVGKITGADRKQIAKAKGSLVMTINNAAEQGMEMSEAEVLNLVEEYSETNGVGQRKY